MTVYEYKQNKHRDRVEGITFNIYHSISIYPNNTIVNCIYGVCGVRRERCINVTVTASGC